SFVDETVVSGLNQPNGMAFLPDGRLLVTELTTGKIRMIVNGHVASTDPMITVDSVTTGVERGLQGIAVDPRWPTFPYVYVGYTHTGSRMTLARYTATGDLTSPTAENLTLGSKRTLIHNLPDNVGNHNGLGLRFATDGKLLLTLGDDDDRCQAHVNGSLKGKLLRLEVTRIPAGGGGPVPRAMLIPSSGNPFVGPDSNASLVYAQGLRNPWRFTVDPGNGAILLGDVGEDTYEELDEMVAGGNYGWPFREGPLVRTGVGCTDPGTTKIAPILSLDRNTGFIAVIAGAVYRTVMNGTYNWPTSYNGSLFYGDFYNGKLRRLTKSGSTWSTPSPVPGQPNSSDWATGLRYMVDFAVGKDGSLYYLRAFDDAGAANTGMVKRIRYSGTVDVPGGPLAERALSASPNPFHNQVDLSWRLARPSAVVIEVFDTSGRRIRRFDENSAAGRVTWDGTDERGAREPAGVYLARLRHEGGSQTVRILLVR
ncbi:MAG TPA: PQQ-dependent sugar dehydrogenase, partial [Candidatus Eisenbacteria bacterium]|nr:PQQ-dependent sugar dehydrogenase [Candidatus Eisenbacteria bacterium]